MTETHTAKAIVIGAGPAGLMAAETLAERGVAVHIFDAMPTPARKFLMAGKSGLNITHSEPFDSFCSRFGSAEKFLEPALKSFDSNAVREWALGLGVETFVGSSGRVFPNIFKASPLLRAWLGRLEALGAKLHTRHRWTGWDQAGNLTFETPDGPTIWQAGATVLALGGASWPRLGSDAAWADILSGKGVAVTSFRPANCGFDVGWSDHFRDRFEGEPVKSVGLSVGRHSTKGDFVVTRTGIEGSAVYALAAPLRDALETGTAVLTLDLAPDRSEEQLAAALARPRGKQSMATFLKKAVGLTGAKASLLRECAPNALATPEATAHAIKHLPVNVAATRPIAEAISTAGGIPFSELDSDLMLVKLPGVFAAGEMLDWEAPTGGYLITACLAEGRQVANGVLRRIGFACAPSA